MSRGPRARSPPETLECFLQFSQTMNMKTTFLYIIEKDRTNLFCQRLAESLISNCSLGILREHVSFAHLNITPIYLLWMCVGWFSPSAATAQKTSTLKHRSNCSGNIASKKNYNKLRPDLITLRPAFPRKRIVPVICHSSKLIFLIIAYHLFS